MINLSCCFLLRFLSFPFVCFWFMNHFRSIVLILAHEKLSVGKRTVWLVNERKKASESGERRELKMKIQKAELLKWTPTLNSILSLNGKKGREKKTYDKLEKGNTNKIRERERGKKGKQKNKEVKPEKMSFLTVAFLLFL